MTSGATRIRPAQPGDLPAVERLIADAQLPLAGARKAFETGFVADEDTRIVGAAAMERFADGALLRSVVVDPSVRGQSLGQRLTIAAIEEARRLTLPALYLLTTTAAGFFPRLGFVPIIRDGVPPSVQQSIEFRSACPASAVVMELRLR